MSSHYRRILLKLSGEALGGSAGFGLDPEAVGRIADETAEVIRSGVQVGIVVGGGNFFRGAEASDPSLARPTVDAMGMLATVINALALADYLKARNIDAQVMSAVGMAPLAQRFDRTVAVTALEAGGAVIFGAGTGNPYFSTDTAASLRAAEIDADLVAKATKVNGVYDKDPNKHADARRYEKISYAETLEKGLGVMDAAAVALCRDNKLPILVFNLNEPGSIGKAVRGEPIGTLMS